MQGRCGWGCDPAGRNRRCGVRVAVFRDAAGVWRLSGTRQSLSAAAARGCHLVAQVNSRPRVAPSRKIASDGLCLDLESHREQRLDFSSCATMWEHICSSRLQETSTRKRKHTGKQPFTQPAAEQPAAHPSPTLHSWRCKRAIASAPAHPPPWEPLGRPGCLKHLCCLWLERRFTG